MIILIRHAQSEGNKNRDIHQFIPDHRVKLTQHGWTQVCPMIPSLPIWALLMRYADRPKKQAANCAPSSSQTTLYNSTLRPTAAPAKQPKASCAP